MSQLKVDGEPAFRTRFANPYNARLYTEIQRLGVRVRDLRFDQLLTSPPDIVHLHWPELTFLSGHRQWRVVARLLLFFPLLRVARLRGTRLIWTAHNVGAHEQRSTAALRAWYRRWWCANVDGVLSLTEDGVSAVRASYPELKSVPAFVTPHGHYRDEYDFSVHRGAARAELGIDDSCTLILTLGQIRPYKNVPMLIDAVVTSERSDVQLLVAGRPDSPTTADQVRAAAAASPKIRLELEFLSPDRMATVLRAADLVVLPYRAIQNSGSAILALSADRPVVVPELGAMSELQRQIGAHWVHTYSGEFTAAALADALRWLESNDRPARPDLTALDWSVIAARTVSAYRDVLSRPRIGRRARRAGTKNSQRDNQPQPMVREMNHAST
jgi:glycosyltransferase involved in cell wall biosynthesis